MLIFIGPLVGCADRSRLDRLSVVARRALPGDGTTVHFGRMCRLAHPLRVDAIAGYRRQSRVSEAVQPAVAGSSSRSLSLVK
jgi:hypothetical protein